MNAARSSGVLFFARDRKATRLKKFRKLFLAVFGQERLVGNLANSIRFAFIEER